MYKRQVLEDVVSSLSSIANQLGKPTPVVSIKAKNVGIKSTGFELMGDIFAHLLRNCVDHGIELPAERSKLGKPSHGIISINAITYRGNLNIYIKDDGRGLHISSLFEKGVELGKWKKEDTVDSWHIADLIFKSGVSTKSQVTTISGRGVGMDAVKQFLTEQGGNITLILPEVKESSGPFLPFELMVSLPPEAVPYKHLTLPTIYSV